MNNNPIMVFKEYTGYDCLRMGIAIGCFASAVFFFYALWAPTDLMMKMNLAGLALATLGIGLSLFSAVDTDRQLRKLLKK